MKAVLHNRVLQHILFWSFEVLLYTGNYMKDGNFFGEITTTLLFLPLHMTFTYSQLYIFIPRLLLRRKIISYILVTMIVTHILCCVNLIFYVFVIYPYVSGQVCTYFRWNLLLTFDLTELRTIFSFFLICSMGAAVKLLKKWYYEQNRNQVMEKEKIAMELEMLKAQVHPHFLFNTLNNLYALTMTKSDMAPVTVSHLSGLLRYMLYECNEKEVPLKNEIDILHKYIELEKLRYTDRLDVSFSYSGDMSKLKIAPLILLPFVENSFKHGVSNEIDQCWINLHMHTEGNQFTFNLSNSRSHDTRAQCPGGIGLQNIRKRLELLYAGRYTLLINEEADIYNIKLQVELSATQATLYAPEPVIRLQPTPAIV